MIKKSNVPEKGKCVYCGRGSREGARVSCSRCFQAGVRYVYWEQAMKEGTLNLSQDVIEEVRSRGLTSPLVTSLSQIDWTNE